MKADYLLMPVVLADFQNYSLPKGWIYFDLLRIGSLTHNSSFLTEAQAVAQKFYSTWYNPRLGYVYDVQHKPGDYSTNHSLQCGAALIDAGIRWNQPAWVQAGQKTIDHIIAVGLNPKYHLFYNSMIVGTNGQDRVQNYQGKPSTQGEAVDALMTAYTLPRNQQYLTVANQVLSSMFGSSGLWDSAWGGFYFARDLHSGAMYTDYKETRSQSLMLIGLHHYNQVKPDFLSQEQALTAVITNHFYQATYHGYFYRVTPDFQVYVSKPGAGIGVEDYFTTEAMGSAVDALLRTEM